MIELSSWAEQRMNSKLSGFLTIGQKTIAAPVVVQKLMSQLDDTLKSTT